MTASLVSFAPEVTVLRFKTKRQTKCLWGYLQTDSSNEQLPVLGAKCGSCSASVFGGGCVVTGDTEDTTE